MYKGKVIGDCGTTKQGFTGKEKCDSAEEIPILILLAPSGERFPLDQDEFNENLQTYINEGKLIPISDVSDASPEGGDANTAQIGSYGRTKTVNANAYSRVFLIDGGDCRFKSLKTLDGDWDVFVLDRTMKLRGYEREVGGAGYFCGHDADVFTYENGANGGSPYNIAVRVGYGVNYDNQRKDRHTISLKSTPRGLIGVRVEKVSTGVIKVKSLCAGTDYTPVFEDTIDPSIFINESGEAVTTATYNAQDKTITITPTTSAIRVAGADVLSENDVYEISGVNEFIKIE